MSLYRKYRPKAFPDVVGQDHVVSTLENAVAQGKLAHAYLFAGSRGTGKTSVARILAKTMLTHGMDDTTLARQVIQAVDDGNLVDLVEVDAASNTGVDNIRDLIEKIQFSPVVAKAKVYIIDEVHMLSKGAFNALLKTLEEPPPYAYFILATTELQKIPLTIQSRCQRFTFRQIGDDDIVRNLQMIVDAETIHIDRLSLRAIAHHAQGGMRDAISLLDQLRSLPQVTIEDVRQRIGESGQDFVEGIFAAIESCDRETIIKTVGNIEQAGIPLDVFTRQLLGEARSRLHKAIDANQSITELSALLSHLLTALRDIRVSPVPGLALESALLGLCAGSEEPAAEKPRLFHRKKAEKQDSPLLSNGNQPVVSRVEPQIAAKQTPAKQAAPSIPETSAPPAKKPADDPAVIEAPALSLEAIDHAWPHIVKDVPTAWVRMSLKNARPYAMRGHTLLLNFASAFHRDKVAQNDASREVDEVIEKIFKKPVKILCQLEEEGHTTPAAKSDLVNLAEAASEVF